MTEKGSPLPAVSVILPSKNEAAFIAKAIASIKKQKYPSELIEIIVVDNGSVDQSVAIAESAGAKILTKVNCRVGAVRNEGVRHATGDVLAFLDADCEAGESWIADAVRLLFDEGGVGLVGGICCAPAQGSWIERTWAPIVPSNIEKDVNALGCTGLVVKKSVFDQLGGFDEILEAAEDDDFCRKVRSIGLRIVCSPKCAVIHHGYPRSLRAIARRQVWHGSNQLESSTGLKDYLLMLTHLFLFGELLVIAGAILNPLIGGLGLAMMASITALMCAVRIKRRSYERNLLGFMQLFPVLVAYFIGRSIGLLNNYLKVIKGCLGLRV